MWNDHLDFLLALVVFGVFFWVLWRLFLLAWLVVHPRSYRQFRPKKAPESEEARRLRKLNEPYWTTVPVTCRRCRGSGRYAYQSFGIGQDPPCGACGGKGYTNKRGRKIYPDYK